MTFFRCFLETLPNPQDLQARTQKLSNNLLTQQEKGKMRPLDFIWLREAISYKIPLKYEHKI